MQNKFQNKYRIPSARLQTWDYANNGAYFITICTQNRHHFFGTIQNQEMQLSEIGKLAVQFWMEIPNHFPFIELGNFVVMPNHVHGILIINHSVETRFIASNDINIEPQFIASNENNNEPQFIVSNDNNNEPRCIAPNENNNEPRCIAPNDINNNNNNNNETRLIASLQGNIGGFSGNKNPMINENISKIIRWYKGRCSFECRKINPNFGWQTRFHDHIIRNAKSFDTIQNYIFENPLNWKNDKFYKNDTKN
ncbi:transposase [Flavobacterium sp. N2820]|uniref:transposase n=1 Tax=Flavobacterium sp. N2820 TaxID=2986834 RepID=UPI00222573F5|nr:transposase [Flavobacterium sp. N2820]